MNDPEEKRSSWLESKLSSVRRKPAGTGRARIKRARKSRLKIQEEKKKWWERASDSLKDKQRAQWDRLAERKKQFEEDNKELLKNGRLDRPRGPKIPTFAPNGAPLGMVRISRAERRVLKQMVRDEGKVPAKVRMTNAQCQKQLGMSKRDAVAAGLVQ